MHIARRALLIEGICLVSSSHSCIIWHHLLTSRDWCLSPSWVTHSDSQSPRYGSKFGRQLAPENKSCSIYWIIIWSSQHSGREIWYIAACYIIIFLVNLCAPETGGPQTLKFQWGNDDKPLDLSAPINYTYSHTNPYPIYSDEKPGLSQTSQKHPWCFTANITNIG